jgi:hypothetical protein
MLWLQLRTHQLEDFTPSLLLQDKAVLQALTDTASLLTEVAGSLTQQQTAQLEADVITAASAALATAGSIEAAAQNRPYSLSIAQPQLTSEGRLQHQQTAAEASAKQLQQMMSLSLAISHVG